MYDPNSASAEQEMVMSRSSFVLLGLGHEPDQEEILQPLLQVLGAELLGDPVAASNGVPTAADPLAISVGDRVVPILMWVDEIDEEVERHVHLDPLAREEEQKTAMRSDWALHVVALLKLDDPFACLQVQLQVLDTLMHDTVRQAIDGTALRVLWPSGVRDLLAFPQRPPLSDLYTVHLLDEKGARAHATGRLLEPDAVDDGDDQRLWAHTHGLSRFGLPEIETFEVPAHRSRALLELLDSVVERLVDSPEMGERTFPLGKGIRGVLLPLEDILETLPAGVAGGDPQVRLSDETLDGTRVVLAGLYTDEEAQEARVDWDLAPLLEQIDQGGMLYRSAGNTSRMQVLAQHRLPMLRDLWEQHRDGEWRVLVKIPVPEANGKREHVWFEVENLDGGAVEGWPVAMLQTSPESSTSSNVDLHDLSAFVLITPEGRWDATRLPELVRRLATAG